MKTEFGKFLNDDNKTKNDFQNIYTSIQYIIIFLVNYEFVFDLNDKKYNLNYISKILGKRNYQLNDLLLDLFNNYGDIFGINNLLFIYEKIETKYFEYVCNEIEKNDIVNKSDIISFSLVEYFNNNKDLLLNEEILINGFKKYIMRYCIGDNQDKKEIIKKIDINKIFERKSIWHFILLKEEHQIKFKDEVNKILNINGEENNLIKYILNKLFASNKKLEEKKKKEKTIIDDLDDEDDEEEGRRTRLRKRRKRRVD